MLAGQSTPLPLIGWPPFGGPPTSGLGRGRASIHLWARPPGNAGRQCVCQLSAPPRRQPRASVPFSLTGGGWTPQWGLSSVCLEGQQGPLNYLEISRVGWGGVVWAEPLRILAFRCLGFVSPPKTSSCWRQYDSLGRGGTDLLRIMGYLER